MHDACMTVARAACRAEAAQTHHGRESVGFLTMATASLADTVLTPIERSAMSDVTGGTARATRRPGVNALRIR